MLVSRVNVGVLDLIASRILDLTNGRAEVVSSDVDASTRAMFTVLPGSLLLRSKPCWSRGRGSLAIARRIGRWAAGCSSPGIAASNVGYPTGDQQNHRDLAGLAVEWCEKLAVWRAFLVDEIDANSILSRLGETDMTFVIAGWVPAAEFEKVKSALQETIGEAILVRQLPMTAVTQKWRRYCSKSFSSPSFRKPGQLAGITSLRSYRPYPLDGVIPACLFRYDAGRYRIWHIVVGNQRLADAQVQGKVWRTMF